MKSELIKRHSTARKTEISAMHPSTKTFGIPELLEVILENATPRDVLLWQRVNKTWQIAIKTSPRIQKKLFFKTKPCRETHEQIDAVWNPFMGSFSEEQINSACCREIRRLAFDGKCSYPAASWKKMFVTNPAATSLRTLVYDSEEAKSARPMVCRSGVTIGQLADFQAEVNATHAHSALDVDIYFCVRCDSDGDDGF